MTCNLFMHIYSPLILPAMLCHAHFSNEKVKIIFSYEAEIYLEDKPYADSGYNHRLEHIVL